MEKKIKVLELFSGTHSVGKVCSNLNYHVVSVDINDYKGKYVPTHKVDILEFDYKQYKQDYFDIVWASPPCTTYSRLQTSWLGKKKRNDKGELYTFTKKHMNDDMLIGDSFVLKSLEIIKYFNPSKWYIENPKTGRLKDREFMHQLNYYDVDYCKYSDWGYKKSTRIWTNLVNFKPKICKRDCDNLITLKNKHKIDCGNNRRKHKNESSRTTTKLLRYRIPPKLIKELLTCL